MEDRLDPLKTVPTSKLLDELQNRYTTIIMLMVSDRTRQNDMQRIDYRCRGDPIAIYGLVRMAEEIFGQALVDRFCVRRADEDED